MQKSYLCSFFYSPRSYRLLYNTFFCTRDTTYFLGSNFLCFLPPDCSTQHKGWLECLSVSLSVSLGEAMSSEYLLSGSIDDVRDTSVFLLERLLLSPNLEIEAYSAITSVFGIPSFTSEPTICINGWKRGKRKPRQDCKHF